MSYHLIRSPAYDAFIRAHAVEGADPTVPLVGSRDVAPVLELGRILNPPVEGTEDDPLHVELEGRGTSAGNPLYVSGSGGGGGGAGEITLSDYLDVEWTIPATGTGNIAGPTAGISQDGTIWPRIIFMRSNAGGNPLAGADNDNDYIALGLHYSDSDLSYRVPILYGRNGSATKVSNTYVTVFPGQAMPNMWFPQISQEGDLAPEGQLLGPARGLPVNSGGSLQAVGYCDGLNHGSSAVDLYIGFSAAE